MVTPMEYDGSNDVSLQHPDHPRSDVYERDKRPAEGKGGASTEHMRHWMEKTDNRAKNLPGFKDQEK